MLELNHHVCDSIFACVKHLSLDQASPFEKLIQNLHRIVKVVQKEPLRRPQRVVIGSFHCWIISDSPLITIYILFLVFRGARGTEPC